jgi:serine/threonine protein phosphatase PrpC
VIGAGASRAFNHPNEDAFLVRLTGRAFPFAAVLDGAGKAGQVAARVAQMLDLLASVKLEEAARDETWRSLVRRLDLQAGSGAATTTLVMCAVVDEQAVIVSAGDSFAVYVPLDGPSRIVTETSKRRLGSGEAQAFVARIKLAPRDTIVLASDGLLGLGLAGIDRAVRAATMRDIGEVPEILLDAAAKRGGLSDDATVVVMRG